LSVQRLQYVELKKVVKTKIEFGKTKIENEKTKIEYGENWNRGKRRGRTSVVA
jgi:hypothetical protein